MNLLRNIKYKLCDKYGKGCNPCHTDCHHKKSSIFVVYNIGIARSKFSSIIEKGVKKNILHNI